MEPQADLPAASSFKVPRLCAEICAACRKCITDRTILAVRVVEENLLPLC